MEKTETSNAAGEIAILYTDGGARPSNPGPAGSGIHGYVYTDAAKKPVIISNHFLAFIKPSEGNSVPKVTPTTEGYLECDKDGNTQSKATLVEPTSYIDIVCSYPEDRTNNYAELNAILEAFSVCSKIDGLKKVIILTDSQYSLDAIRYTPQWKNIGWKTSTGSEVKNKETLVLLSEVKEDLSSKGIKVEFRKVKGHSLDLGNHHADYLATIGCIRSQFGEFLVDSKIQSKRKYWEPEPNRHPMLEGKRIFYPRDVRNVNPNHVFLVDPGGATDLTIGKRDHEGYSIVQLNEPCPSYETVLKAQARYPTSNWPMNLRTDRLYNKFIQKFLIHYGENILTPNSQGSGLYFLDGGVVSLEHNPPILIYRVNNVFADLLERLEEFKTLETSYPGLEFPDDEHTLGAMDITNDFFETIEKKKGKEILKVKQLRKDIPVGYDQHTVDVTLSVGGKEVSKKLPLTLGMDLPLRNSLKRLEAEDPSVILVVWKTSPGSYQYGCIVESKTGIGIWSNYHCARFFL